MPPKPKISRESILDAALALVREEGDGALTARRIAARLGCSTQPVLYRFPRLDALREAVYRRADALHTGYIMDIQGRWGDPMLEIGMNYIRFAAEEKPLFRFLFQSDHFAGHSLDDLLRDPALDELLAVVRQSAGLDAPQALALFRTLFLTVHGCASLLANNAMAYDPGEIEGMLRALFDCATAEPSNDERR